ncbi:MAG: DUF1893 domain-containing protein [Tidjanibacter sp.]|nr:DUF1893 domain-containing protein [Tidjanibacter sp.]
MADLPTIERAVALLRSSDYTIAILTSSGEAITSRERGVATLMRLLAERAEVLRGAVVADKVVGRAAAALFVVGGCRRLHTAVLSRAGEEMLRGSAVEYSYDTLTEAIINRRGDGFCPMEMAMAEAKSAEEAYAILKERVLL